MPLPREQLHLFGHEAAEAELLQGYRAGRLHHAWLIGGREGIGKATLAYRFARFLLAQGGGGDPAPATLAVDPGHKAARQVAQLAHPNLLVLDPALFLTDRKEQARTIPVDAVRRVVSFLGSTASDGGYRICLIDSVEDLNANGANALLKAVEEPPARTVFLIVSHAPQRVMATIRSRCRKLALRPLDPSSLRRALAAGLGEDAPDEARLDKAIALADGSVSHAIEMLDPDKTALIDEVTQLLEALPDLEMKRVLGLADKVANRQGDEAYALTLDTVEAWLSAAVRQRLALGAGRLASLARVSEMLGETAPTVAAYNLDRRPFVIQLFGDLAEAVRKAG